MASTVPDDGAEKCYYWSDCKTLTTKRFRCILGHTVWMCSNCHRDRPVCPLDLDDVGALCRAEEKDYKTDTDLDSRPDFSISMEELPFPEDLDSRPNSSVSMQELPFPEEYEGKALHAMAGITCGDKKRDALRDARKATRTSEEFLFEGRPESEWLLLEVKRLDVGAGLTWIERVYSHVTGFEPDFSIPGEAKMVATQFPHRHPPSPCRIWWVRQIPSGGDFPAAHKSNHQGGNHQTLPTDCRDLAEISLITI